MKPIVLIYLFLCSITTSNAVISDYLTSITSYFGYNHKHDVDSNEIFPHKIPYEVSTTDEKFINEAAKLTGVALTELDSCQQRVVLKLKSDCNKMNDEQLAKMAVHLLNCQSYAEGRKIYPCTDQMSIKDCTTNMDSDTWTSYHLMSNRARAVCYTIRQSQFRGLAEHTVNRLMEAANNQLNVLLNIEKNQDRIQNIASTTFESLEKGHKHLSKQQQNLEKAQFHGQLMLEDNINRLVEEKRLILESHSQLISMTQTVQNKLENSANQLNEQNEESRLNHKELINDLLEIQKKAQDIFGKIDESSRLLIKQTEDFKEQYETTLKNLAEVNHTVHNLVSLVGGTRQALEERMSWITTALGGTDLAVERLYLIIWHCLFMLGAMLSCAFLAARPSTRLIVATLPPLNLAVGLHGEYQNFDPIWLTGTIGIFILIQTVLITVMNLEKIPKPFELQWISQAPKKSPTDYEKTDSESSVNDYKQNIEPEYRNNNADVIDQDAFVSLTPPLSRIGHYSATSRSRSNTPLKLNTSFRSNCLAKTRVGTPCKLSSLPGRDYCYRHQTGDSVMG